MFHLAVLAAKIFLTILYCLLSLLPTKNRIVCISRQSSMTPIDFILIDEFIRNNHPNYEVAILAKKLDNKAIYCLHILKQVFYIATSKAVLLDSYCIAVGLLAGQIKKPIIQMWHALGNMKKFGFTAIGSQEGRSQRTAELLNMHKGYSSVLISSKNFIEDYAAGFGVDPAIIKEMPLPRADLLSDSKHAQAMRNEIVSSYPTLLTKKNIVYCPTFRMTPAPNEREAMEALVNAIDFSKYNLIYKPHPISTQQINDERVFICPSNIEALYVADYVISDYSTVIYEAGLLGVPVYLYAYDWDDYSEKRALNIDIANDVPTLFTEKATTIMESIDSNAFDYKAFEGFVRNNIAIPENQSCTSQIVEHIFALVKQASDK